MAQLDIHSHIPTGRFERIHQNFTEVYDLASANSAAFTAYVATRRTRATSAVTLFVRTDGNDANNGLTNNSGGAFLTIQAALNHAANNYDMAGSNLTIQCGSGTYTTDNIIYLPDIVGGLQASTSASGCRLVGSSSATPTTHVIEGTIEKSNHGTQWYVTGFKHDYGGTPAPGFGGAFSGHAGGWIRVGKANIGTGWPGAQVNATYRGTVEFMDNYTISAGAVTHLTSIDQGYILALSGITVTVTGTPDFSGMFVYCSRNSTVTYTGATITGAATGVRYYSEILSSINTGAGSATFFPGDVGATADGASFGWYF